MLACAIDRSKANESLLKQLAEVELLHRQSFVFLSHVQAQNQLFCNLKLHPRIAKKCFASGLEGTGHSDHLNLHPFESTTMVNWSVPRLRVMETRELWSKKFKAEPGHARWCTCVCQEQGAVVRAGS